MDVVRTNVERIGGTVSVSSVLGQGTTFTFTIPLTLAIIPALLVSIGAHRYAIPQTSLVELVRLTGDDTENLIEDMHGLAVYRLRGKLLPIVDAAGVLQVQKKAARVGRKRLQLAVLQADGRSYGLVVDEVHGTEEIVVKPIGGHYGGIGCFAGATILGDGIVALILDVVGFANRAGVDESRIAEAALSGTVEAVAEHADRTQFVIVSDADQRRFAIPLTAWRGSRSSTARRSRRWPAAGSCSTATGSCHSPRSAAGRTTRTGPRRWAPAIKCSGREPPPCRRAAEPVPTGVGGGGGWRTRPGAPPPVRVYALNRFPACRPHRSRRWARTSTARVKPLGSHAMLTPSSPPFRRNEPPPLFRMGARSRLRPPQSTETSLYAPWGDATVVGSFASALPDGVSPHNR